MSPREDMMNRRKIISLVNILTVFSLLAGGCGKPTAVVEEAVVVETPVEGEVEQAVVVTAVAEAEVEPDTTDFAGLLQLFEEGEISEAEYEARFDELLDYVEETAGAPDSIIAMVREPLLIEAPRVDAALSSAAWELDASINRIVPLSEGKLIVNADGAEVEVDVLDLPVEAVPMDIAEEMVTPVLLRDAVVFDAYPVTRAFAEQMGYAHPFDVALKYSWYFGDGSLHPLEQDGGSPDRRYMRTEAMRYVAIRVPEDSQPALPYHIGWCQVFQEDLGGEASRLAGVTVYGTYGREPDVSYDTPLAVSQDVQFVDPMWGGDYHWIGLTEATIAEPMDLWVVAELPGFELEDEALHVFADETTYRGNSYSSPDGVNWEHLERGDFMIRLFLDKAVSGGPEHHDFTALHTYYQEGGYEVEVTIESMAEPTGSAVLASRGSPLPFRQANAITVRKPVLVRSPAEVVEEIFKPQFFEWLHRVLDKKGIKISQAKLEELFNEYRSHRGKTEEASKHSKMLIDAARLALGKKFGLSFVIDGLASLLKKAMEPRIVTCVSPKSVPDMITQSTFDDAAEQKAIETIKRIKGAAYTPTLEEIQEVRGAVNCLYFSVVTGHLILKIPEEGEVYIWNNSGQIDVEEDNDGALMVYRNHGNIEVSSNNGEKLEVADNFGSLRIDPENDETITIKRNWGTVYVNEYAHDNETIRVTHNMPSGSVTADDYDNNLIVNNNYGTIGVTNSYTFKVENNFGGEITLFDNRDEAIITWNLYNGKVVINRNVGSIWIHCGKGAIPPGTVVTKEDLGTVEVEPRSCQVGP